MAYLLNIRLEEELERLDGIPDVLPPDFHFFTQAEYDPRVRDAYEIMQDQYVLREQDVIPYDDALLVLRRMQEQLMQNPAWAMGQSSQQQSETPSFGMQMGMI